MLLFYRKILLCIFVFLSGCAASGPVFKEQAVTNSNVGTVYFYRVYSFQGAGAYPYLYIDGEYKGPLRAGGYLYFHLPEGEYEVTLGSIDGPDSNWNWGPEPYVFNLRVKTGESQFYRMRSVAQGDGPSITVVGSVAAPVAGTPSTVTLERVEKEVALREIKSTKLSQ